MLNNCRVIIYTIFLLTITTYVNASSGWIVFHESEFKGKVIDVETIKPIEGAVVAAIYYVKYFGPFGSDSAYADVQETLTDSNGEFTIPGNIFFHLWPFTSGGSKTKFIIFKPGYRPYPFNDFLIYPINKTIHIPEGRIETGGKIVKTIKSHDVHLEGIVFERKFKNKEKRKLYEEKFNGSSPFIPLKNPLEKVRNLDIPFDADVMKAEEIWTSRDVFGRYPAKEPFKYYALIGLSKVKTMEERRKSHSWAEDIPNGYKNKVPKWKKMLDDEYNFNIKGVR